MRSCRSALLRHRGFTLIETALALAIASIAAGLGLWSLAQSMEREKAKMQGQQLAVLGAALSAYSRQHFTALATGASITGFASPAQPTLAELRSAGFLDPTFSTNSIYQTGYTLRVTRSGPCSVGVTSPGCSISSLAALSAPMQHQGRTAWASLGEAVNAIGAQGGFSSQGTPAVISSANGTWVDTNPLGAAGILAYREVYGQSESNTFLRRDGTFPMTGTLQMAGNDIRGGGGDVLTEGGRIQTAGGAISAGSGSISGGAIAGTSVTANSVVASGSVSAGTIISSGPLQGASATILGGISGRSLSVSGGNVTLGGGALSELQVQSPGAPCSKDGELAMSHSSEVLSCQSSRWRRQSTNADGGLVVERVATEGASCTPRGSVAINSSGLLLSCQAGQWAKAGSSGFWDGRACVPFKLGYTWFMETRGGGRYPSPTGNSAMPSGSVGATSTCANPWNDTFVSASLSLCVDGYLLPIQQGVCWPGPRN